MVRKKLMKYLSNFDFKSCPPRWNFCLLFCLKKKVNGAIAKSLKLIVLQLIYSIGALTVAPKMIAFFVYKI